MSAHRGQATVEWVAVLMVAGALAVGLATATRTAVRQHVDVRAELRAIAAAGAAPSAVPVPPVIGGEGLPGVDGSSVVSVAAALAAAGIAEVPPGSNRGPGIDTFTEGNAEPWCADFVSWVLRAAGHPFARGPSASWRLAWTGDVRAWFVAHAAFRERLVAQPAPGDVVWFEHGHVGIVERVDGDVLRTIEGNAQDAVTRRVYPHWRLNADVGGFGRPGLDGR